MIRTFRLYRLDKFEYLPKSEGETLPLVKLSDLALTTPRPLSRLLSDLAGRLSDEHLEVVRCGPPRWELTLTGRWPARTISVATGPSPLLPVSVSLWLRWMVPWLIVFEANRALADAASRLVAAALAGNASAVCPIIPDAPHWEVLKDWAENALDGSGALLGGRFYRVTIGGTPVERITLRCVPGSDPRLILECFQTAAGIGELLIQTPRLKSVERNVLCRVNRLGVIRVYGTDISDEVVDALLTELEGLWGFVPENQ